MAASFREIPLQGLVPGGASIEFLRADIAATRYVPFAIIYYSDEGEEQPDGLRLDLDKQVFADHLEDKGKDEFIRQAAPAIARIVGEEQRRRTPDELWPAGYEPV